MDQRVRLKIAIILNFRRGWMGGIIYLINLVNALNFLEEEDKPEVIVFYNPNLSEFLKDFRYPYLKVVQWNFYGFAEGYFRSWVSGKNAFVEEIIQKYKPDGIYPLNDWPVSGRQALARGTRIVAWIPDLQHKFYPQFFNPLRVFLREIRIKWLLKNAQDLVVSSYDVESHFRKFYKIHKNLSIHVVRFVSSIDDSDFPKIKDILNLYKLPSEYFIVSNQFTNHKNHLVVLRALIELKKRNSKVYFVFTGKMEFKGNEKYIQEIRKTIAENQLEDAMRMLGIIPRQNQLTLMKFAKAVVQPSLFEGWSTVIEDAKTLQVPVIAADLPVNIEQLGSKGFFFDRHDAHALADVLASFKPGVITYESYQARINAFAVSFVSIFK